MRPTIAALLLCLALSAPTYAATPHEGPADALARTAGVQGADVPARAETLVELVARADTRFGIDRDAAAYAPLANLDPRLADVTADLLHALLWAADERDAAYAGVAAEELAALVDDEGTAAGQALLARIDAERVRMAAVGLARVVEVALPTLEAIAPAAPAAAPIAAAPLIDVFPVLGIDPLGVANVYPHDYFLSIDLGGNDVYDNNAGGSIIARGFVLGDPATFGPRIAGLTIGGEFEDSGEAYTATLAIDVAGDDTYGVYKTPSLVGGSRDKLCTQGPLVRRVVVQGSGSGGIGQLYDLGGNDDYRGKTLAQGNGHIAGVGILYDAGGDDRYTAIRSSQGSAVLQGVGVLLDAGGNDVYRSLSPPGGIWNVDRGRCDATQRLALGSAVVQGAALFHDASGDDTYRVDSQGLGHVEAAQSVAVFLDSAGTDDYGGYAGRADGATVTMQVLMGAAVFRDV